MDNISKANITFCATQKEIRSIKKACNDLSQKLDPEKVVTIPVDTAEINGKLYLSSIPDRNGKLKLKVKYIDENVQGYTTKYINYGDLKENKKFITDEKNQLEICKILDQFKYLLKKMNEN